MKTNRLKFQVSLSSAWSASLAMILLLLSACSGSGGNIVDDQPAAFEFPTNVERQVSDNHQDRFRLGSDFDPDLPNLRVEAVDTFALFSPADGGEPPEQLAYATYNFYLDDLEGWPLISFNWEAAPAPENFIVGVSNWEEDMWQWFDGPENMIPLDLESLEPYVSAEGILLVMVMVMGDQDCTLKWIQGPHLGISNIDVVKDEGSYSLTFESYVPSIGTPPFTIDAAVGFHPEAGATPFDCFPESDEGYNGVQMLMYSGPTAFQVSTVNIEPGDYLIAIRQVDSLGQANVFWYPRPVTLPASATN